MKIHQFRMQVIEKIVICFIKHLLNCFAEVLIILYHSLTDKSCVGSARASPAVLPSPSVFSTSPAANVLQLNYPLPKDHASLVSSQGPTGPPNNSHISLALPISLATKRGTQLLKIGQTAQPDSITK